MEHVNHLEQGLGALSAPLLEILRQDQYLGKDFNCNDGTAFEIVPGELYELVLDHISENFIPKYQSSFGARKRHAPSKDNKGNIEYTSVKVGLGVGAFKLDGEMVYFSHATQGNVVGTSCGPAIMTRLTLITAGDSSEKLKKFMEQLVAASEKTDEHMTRIYKFNVKHQYWRRDAMIPARPFESVVLPEKEKNKLMNDIENFVAPDSKDFYSKHGIPYRRGYLFHGPPGTGKTSLVQALASKYKRNVCALSPAHPEMTDDILKHAFASIPGSAIIVLEDVDAIFDGGRNCRMKHSTLTFSGILNALDGVSSANGRICILTTNHRERLDPALIRAGRVDLHINFPFASKEIYRGMFNKFYPDSRKETAHQFAETVDEKLGKRRVPAAALQHFFLINRHNDASTILENCGELTEDIWTRTDEIENSDDVDEGVDVNNGEKEKEKESQESPKSNFGLIHAGKTMAVLFASVFLISTGRGK